jgi:N-acetylneuraminic acid mutarotase
MLVWGGMGGNVYSHPEAIGGRYNPATDTWQSMSTVDAPPAMYGHTAIWTGSKMIVWGGSTNLSASGSSMGGAYDPATDTWELTPTLGAPSGRSLHTAVWTGTEMAIWGGRTLAGAVNSGGMYDPQSKAWRPISDTCGAAERFDHTAVWTGGEMIIWGGSRNGALVTSGAQYNPTTDAWQHVSLAGAPAKRLKHSAIWTGAAMIIWGGQDSLGALKSGGRYQP